MPPCLAAVCFAAAPVIPFSYCLASYFMCSLVNARQCLAIRCSIPTTNHLCLALGHIYMLLKTFAQLPSAAGGQKTKKKKIK